LNENIIKIEDVSMCFNLSKERVDSLKEYFVKLLKGQLFFEQFWAIKNVNINIKKGEALGIVGLNGSGKSTLLKLIAGVLKPTKGSVKVYGSIAPLIELGAGFDMDLTARENVFLNGALLGFTRKFIMEKFKAIIDFAELWEFLDVPMKNYSSGMIARLGFAIATMVHADILIVDEVLSVGDYLFQQKCEKRMQEMMGSGTTIIFVSHSIEQVKMICRRVLWLQRGEMQMLGGTEEVCGSYETK